MTPRVRQIKEMVDLGLYTVNAEKIAEAMIWRLGLGFDRTPGPHYNCLLPRPRCYRPTGFARK